MGSLGELLEPATNEKFPGHFVMGDYGHFGMMSTSKEALEDFVAHHGPLQCD